MHLDVRDLKSFYVRTHLGRAARASILRAVESLWSRETVAGLKLVGFGFAPPAMGPFLEKARRAIALMPGEQGVVPWPPSGDNISVLGEETAWPIDTGSVDRLILLHGLETSENPSGLLAECWRVLGPGGKALFIVPNRSGIWARRDRTPFGYGRPYSLGQLETQLKRHSFVPERHVGALFLFPSHRRFFQRMGPLWERIGQHLPLTLGGGALLVEATKQVYAPKSSGITEKIKAPLEALGGLAKAPPKPVSRGSNMVSAPDGQKDG